MSQMEAEAGQLRGRLAGLSLPRQVFVLSIWPLMEQALNFLVGFVDMSLAAHLEPESVGVAAADAIGIAGHMGWLIGLLQGCVAIGTGALVARAIGGGRKTVANAALGQSVTMIGLVGLFSAVVLFFIAGPFARLVGAKGLALEQCELYLRVFALAVPFSTQLFIGAAALRAAGDTRTPFLLMLLVNAVNIIVSVALVKMGFGVAGIAAGTCVAWILGSLIMIQLLVRGRSGIRLRLLRMRPHWHTAKRILRIGLPSLFEMLGMWTGNLVMLAIIGRMGEPEDGLLGIFMIAVRIESISFMGGFAIGTAAATLVGQYLGAGNVKRAGDAVKLCLVAAMLLMGAWSAVFLAIPEQLALLVTDQPLHLQTVPTMVWLCAFGQPMFAMAIVISNAMRGAGDTRTPMGLTYFITYFIRVPWVYLGGIVLGLNIIGVWTGLVAEWYVRGGLFAAFFFLHRRWQRVEV